MFQRAVDWRRNQQRLEQQRQRNYDSFIQARINGEEDYEDLEVTSIEPPEDDEAERRRQEGLHRLEAERVDREQQRSQVGQDTVELERQRQMVEIVRERQMHSGARMQIAADYALAMQLQESVVEEEEEEEQLVHVVVEREGPPPPLEPEELVVNVECKICFVQIANIGKYLKQFSNCL